MTRFSSLLTPTALLAAITLAGTPAFAQQKYHGRENPPSGQAAGQPSGQQPSGGGESRERAQPRAEAPPTRGEAPQQRGEAPRAQESPRAQGGAAPSVAPRQERPQAQPQRVPPTEPQRAVPRAEGSRDNRGSDNRGNQNRGYDNRGYENRGNDSRRWNRGNVYAPHYDPYYSPRGYGYYGTPSYYRPYVFRPQFSIGFGTYAGYPVPYAYSFPYPIEVYGYRAPRERVMITPGSRSYGGVALEMSPYDADVFVDGEYAGRVEDFDGTTQPLTLASGLHEIEVQAPGYEPLRFNVLVQPGQVIPFRGDLRPY